MPLIMPVSDLRNDSSVLEKMEEGAPVYLTENGRGCYGNVDIKDQEEYEKMKAALKLMCELDKGRRSGEKDGWISEAEVNKRFLSRKNG